MDSIIVVVSTDTYEQAELMMTTILQAKLAAGVNVLPMANTFYWYRGELLEGTEIVLLFRTVQRHTAQIASQLMAINSEVEVSIVSIEQLNDKYAAWIEESIL